MSFRITVEPVTIVATSIPTDDLPETLIMFTCPALDAMLDDGESTFQSILDPSVIDLPDGHTPFRAEFIQNITGPLDGLISYRLIGAHPLT